MLSSDDKCRSGGGKWEKILAKFKGRIVTYDHRHKSAIDKGTPYVFSSAQQLLEDFFSEVNRILKEVTK